MACRAEDVTCFTTNANNSGLCCIGVARFRETSCELDAPECRLAERSASESRISAEKFLSQHAELGVSWEALALIPENEEGTFFSRDLFSESAGLLVRVVRACSDSDLGLN